MADSDRKLPAQVVIKRMITGELALFVGTERVVGIAKIDSWCDTEGSFTAIVFPNAFIEFATEEPKRSALN